MRCFWYGFMAGGVCLVGALRVVLLTYDYVRRRREWREWRQTLTK